MKIIANEVMDVAGSAERVFQFNNNGVGDSVASELYLNPLSDCNITVKGYVSKEDTTGVSLKCVDIAKLEKKDAVIKAGNYLYMIGSYYQVKVNVTGTAKVLVKYLY